MNEAKVIEIKKDLAENPANAEKWFELGSEYFESEFQNAVECFSRAIELEPFTWKYYFNRGRKYLSLDHFQQAMADFSMVLRLYPMNDDSWHYRGVAHFFLGEYEAAASNFLKCIEVMLARDIHLIPPTVDWAWMSYMRLGDEDRAKAVLEKYIYPDIPCEDCDWVYRKRVFLYAGYTSPEDYVKEINESEDVEGITEYYALAMYYRFIAKDMNEYKKMLEKTLAFKTMHHAFGYKLALSDMKELEG